MRNKTEEVAQMASRLDVLTEQEERADKLARRIETQFKRAKDTIAIGELESAQRRLLDAIAEYEAFLDEHLL